MTATVKMLLLLAVNFSLLAGDKPLNIAFVHEIFLPEMNGIITETIDLSKYLIEKGHRVIFIAPAREESTCTLIEGKIPVYYIPSIDSKAYPGMRLCFPRSKLAQKVLQDEKIDILHMGAPGFVNLACLREANALGIPVIHTFHTNVCDPKYIKHLVKFDFLIGPAQFVGEKLWLKYFIDQSLITTAPSTYIAEYLRAKFPGRNIRTVANGIDTDKFATFDALELLQKNYVNFDPKFTILFIGRLGFEKELEVLLKAISLIQDGRIRLFIIGDGPQETHYKTLSHDLGLNQRVFFLGRIPNAALVKSGLIQHSRVFATASTTETFGLTVLEAICCGIPIVVPDVPVNREMIQGNGLLFQPGDSADLAKKIERLIYEDALHSAYRQASFLTKSKFDKRSSFLQMEQLYYEALAKDKLIDK